MHIFKLLLVLPALTALAVPVTDVTANAVQSESGSLFLERAVPAADSIANTLVIRDQEAVHPESEFLKRDVDTAKPEPLVRERYAPNHHISVSPDNHQIWHRATAIHQPNLPEFIDTSACICGLLLVEDTLDHNGEIVEMWRCTAAVDEDISIGSHGKWYNTTLPSQEVSGYHAGRTWYGNPPWVNETFVLTIEADGKYYELLTPATAEWLQGGDVNCTGIKDQAASAAFYASQS